MPHPDLVFLFSEPLAEEIEVNWNGSTFKKLISCENYQLSIDQEYNKILEIVKNTNKEFSILRKPINYESLQEIIALRPKIIHISCHGDYDHQKKEFYLQFEDEFGRGMVDRFTQSRLQDLLKDSTDHGI